MELRELYQQTILDHNRNPHNCRRIDTPSCSAQGHNPLCGDKVTVYVTRDADTLTDVAFEGSGCAICMASASMMTDAVKGRSLADVETMFNEFHDLVTGKSDMAEVEKLGKLKVFAGVQEFPVRVKCASLPWHTLHSAIEKPNSVVSTE